MQRNDPIRTLFLICYKGSDVLLYCGLIGSLHVVYLFWRAEVYVHGSCFNVCHAD